MNKSAVWNKAQRWEESWHGNCVNSYGEEEKQIVYAQKMGLQFFHNGKSPYNIDLENKSVMDIGSGPYSLLLKCVNSKYSMAVDPATYPVWVKNRYSAASILFNHIKGEDISFMGRTVFDEVWIYNCLQHTDNPEKIIKNAKKYSKIIRIFEWIDTGTNEGHPHILTEKLLNKWLGGQGRVETLNTNTLKGKCFYGIFKGNNYEE